MLTNLSGSGDWLITWQCTLMLMLTPALFLSSHIRKYGRIRVTKSPHLCNLTRDAFGYAYAPEVFIDMDCENGMVVESGFLGNELHTMVIKGTSKLSPCVSQKGRFGNLAHTKLI